MIPCSTKPRAIDAGDRGPTVREALEQVAIVDLFSRNLFSWTLTNSLALSPIWMLGS
jgi:hypothetical protein